MFEQCIQDHNPKVYEKPYPHSLTILNACWGKRYIIFEGSTQLIKAACVQFNDHLNHINAVLGDHERISHLLITGVSPRYWLIGGANPLNQQAEEVVERRREEQGLSTLIPSGPPYPFWNLDAAC